MLNRECNSTDAGFFPKGIVLTNKPSIDRYVVFISKQDLLVRTIALEKTCISADRLGSALI